MNWPGEEREEEHGGEAGPEEELGEEEAVAGDTEVETTGTIIKLKGLVVTAGDVEPESQRCKGRFKRGLGTSKEEISFIPKETERKSSCDSVRIIYPNLPI